MATGVLYCMTTVVPGLIKIGKTTSENFDSRMYSLERHGYSNVAGLKRHFAIEVENYDEKEVLLDEIFSKSRVPNTELFALDIDLVVQLLSSFDGRQIFPKTKTKKDAFRSATEARKVKADMQKIPNGHYYLCENRKGFGNVTATMRVENGLFIVEKGSRCAPIVGSWFPEARKQAVIVDGVLQEDVECHSPSTASHVVLGKKSSGWAVWKNSAERPIDIYRQNETDQ